MFAVGFGMCSGVRLINGWFTVGLECVQNVPSVGLRCVVRAGLGKVSLGLVWAQGVLECGFRG